MSNQIAIQNGVKLDELLEWAKKRGKIADAIANDHSKNGAQPNTTNKLPFFKIGGMPNHLNRSSLIAPIGSRYRQFYRNSILVSRQDCTIEYSGEQLDEADGDILMALLYYSRNHNVGEDVYINRAQLLQLICRDIGRAQYRWLDERLTAITKSTLSITTKYYQIGTKSVFHLISSYKLDQETGNYKFRLDDEWIELFSRKEFSRLHWEKRMQINHRFAIAKALQRIISTDSSRTQKYKIESLKKQFVYTGRTYDFLKILEKNLKELEKVKLINSYTIGQNSKAELQLILCLPENTLT